VGSWMTVVDATGRLRQAAVISGPNFRGASVYGRFALEVGARTIMASDGAGHFGGSANLGPAAELTQAGAVRRRRRPDQRRHPMTS